ncbi:MAG TPA: autotransporter domain-containing protein [Xanthobacteraceae bacterium]
MNSRSAAVAACALVGTCLGSSVAYAQSATWAGPGSEWNTSSNWSPATVPTATAIFAGATPTTVTFGALITGIDTIQFNAGAPAYTFELSAAQTLNITGTGIVNNSANAPTFTGPGTPGLGETINFQNASTAANANFLLTNETLQFLSSSNAGTATITNNASATTNFEAGSSAANATIINNNGGLTIFGRTPGADTATAANAHITNNSGGDLFFLAATTAGNAVIVNNTGGFVQFGDSGLGETATAGNSTITGSGTISFNAQTTAGNATITTNSGGHVFFFDSSSGGSARFATNAGATFDMSGLTAASMTAGSIEGAGSYVLGDKQLVVGSNNLSTEVQGVISGIGGSLDKVGTGTLTLSGVNTYTGPTVIDGGILSVNGSIVSAVTVNAGGTLGGTGTVGPTTVNAGGILAPGNSIGTVHVAGNVTFNANSIYQVQVNPAGGSDLTVATSATINGGTVQALPAAGTYGASTRYIIVQTTGGVTGTFANVTSSSAFLTPSLSYPTDEVVLTLTRNATSFAAIAQTPNQASVGAALDTSASGSALVQAILPLGNAQALLAFDALSGEIHASVQTAIIDDSLWVRDTLLARMLQASYGGDGGAMGALGFGGPMVAFADAGAGASALAYADGARSGFPIKAPPAPTPSDLVFWAQGTGAWGRIDGDGNAAEMSRTFAGFLTGVDRRFGENWRAGIAAGYSNSSVNVNARASSANVDTAHLAAYAAAGLGSFKLRTGAALSWNTLSTDRIIAFPGFVDTAHANYGAGEGQLFGELGYAMAFGRYAVEPFAGLTFVHLGTESFTESGGAAALAGASNHDDVGYTTLGAHLATRDVLANGMVLIPHATLAYQHALGNVTPAAALAFESTGAGTEITGVPLARDSALVQVGADLQINRQATFGVFYSAEVADNAQDHSFNGRFVWHY